MALPVNPAVLDPAHTGPSLVAAPWTDDQVTNINRHQEAGQFHPFTCGRREHHPNHPGVLVAERDGLHCPATGCGYQQAWVHPFMADRSAMRAWPIARTTEPALGQDTMRAIAARPRPCLLHEDVHPNHGRDCLAARAQWLVDHRHLTGQAARDAYALEVEQRILDRMVREHAPARTRRLNTALSK